MSKIFLLTILTTMIACFSCNFPSQENLINELDEAIYAVPVLQDQIRIQDIFQINQDGVSVFSDDDGKVSVSYEGEVLRDPASVVFPPIFGIIEIPLEDTVFQLDLTMGGPTQNEIDSAVFIRDKLHFNFRSSSAEPLVVTAWIDEISKDGKKLRQTVSFPGTNDGVPVLISAPDIDMNDWILKGNDNKITLHYDARTLDGEKVIIDQVGVVFTVLEFKYAQGFFPKTIRPVEGSFIPINLYNRWIGGTMDFVEPSVKIDVENSFGFPVGADFENMSLETISGVQLELQSTIIDEGFIFNYPELDEVGQIKSTNLEFNKDNSNIAIIFNDRIAKFNYAINAIANPNDEDNLLGYMTSESFYAVQVKVEVPLHLTINDLQIVDTLDLNLNLDQDYIDTAELKLILENNFPVDITSQFYLIDESNNIIDSLFANGPIFLAGGTYNDGGGLTDVTPQTFFVPFTEERIGNLLRADRLVVKPTFRTTTFSGEHIWIYEDYGLDVKMGVKFSLK